jgi:hypothetical protein
MHASISQLGRRGVNGKTVRIGHLTFFFSYSTLVGISAPDIGTVHVRNQWGPTSGAHINDIGGREVSNEEFEKIVEKLAKTHKLGTV